MASKKAVASALAMLGRAFAGDVTPERAELYHTALAELTDDETRAATAYVIRTYTAPFIPPPAVLIAAVKPHPVAVDGESVLKEIARRLASHSPTVGMCYPGAASVQREFGALVAYAYTAAGGASRLYSNDDTTRDIALREFQHTLTDAAKRDHAALPILAGSADGVLLLDARRASLALVGADVNVGPSTRNTVGQSPEHRRLEGHHARPTAPGDDAV